MAAAEDRVVLSVDGERHDGWTSVDIDRDLATGAGQFTLSLTERWPNSPERRTIAEGAACKVMIGSDTVITGWIDRYEASLSADRHSITVSGRDKTGDLIDCSVIHTPSSWSNRTLEQIAAEVIKPFGIGLKVQVSTGAAFPKVVLQQGESVNELLTRLARQRGVLVTSNEEGELVFCRPGQTSAGYALELGGNLESLTVFEDGSDRFSDYVLKGYGPAGRGKGPRAATKDAGVERYRPLMIVNAEETSEGGLGDRAKFEATIRAGRASGGTAVLSGWRAGGELFRLDRLVPVRATRLTDASQWLITGVRFRRGEDGTRTSLTLAPKEAFSLLAIPPKPKKGRKARKGRKGGLTELGGVE